MKDECLCGILHKANQAWLQMHGASQHFGYSYRDATPKAWADTFLATQYQWVFAQYLKHCLQELQPQKLKVTNKKFHADPQYFL
eukprot:15366842-Ditylum_brightwellii.AAC.1